ncbi:hypothetical protein PFMALIP_00211 [Plasmodium falciparum MaliPS096_E11]|uniref:Uncharacterized protein n=2 Tax=Plasmodium falciparum TaxID=5833 RepID=A0A024XFU7_PLAFC|nr:hypothetical protein PFMALIP_00211 [Plasmodium falciparum MaliPS096_E11]ETW63971.1 hypothetical protein PFMC_00206 [Plasmodium falciparum CAMP/Malaysia]
MCSALIFILINYDIKPSIFSYNKSNAHTQKKKNIKNTYRKNNTNIKKKRKEIELFIKKNIFIS